MKHMTWADDVALVANSVPEFDVMAAQLPDRLTAEGMPCMLEKTSMWLATGIKEVQVAGRQVTTQSTPRVLGTTLGTDRVEQRMAAAWCAFGCRKKLPLSLSSP